MAFSFNKIINYRINNLSELNKNKEVIKIPEKF